MRKVLSLYYGVYEALATMLRLRFALDTIYF